MRLDSVTRLLLTLLFMYCFTLGATWNGVLIPQVSLLTLGLISVLFLLWRLIRWRGKWTWYNTLLDPVLLLWAAAFGLSLLTNSESWRKIIMGLWYILLYVGVWYILHDLLSNGKLKKGILIESFLLAGLLNVLFGYFQLAVSNISADGLPRLVSLVGNPNAFGLFMVVLLLLILGQWFTVKNRIARIILAAYFTVSLPILILTFSRGALLGMLAGCVIFAGLMLQTQQQSLGEWWQTQRRVLKMSLVGILGLSLILSIGVGTVLVLQTLNDGGRNPVLRGRIYEDALIAFTEHPLTGHGLFTFGEELGRLQSQPPLQPHSHAHNAFLHIAAELGLVGLGVLLVTIGVGVVALRRRWQTAPGSEKPYLAALIAIIAAYGITHQFDMLVMMPLLALIGVLILVLATTSTTVQPITARWRMPGHPIGMTALWLVLIASGFWSSFIYADYARILQESIAEEAYRSGADQLQAVVDADPNMALYVQQQAYLYGIAASEGDLQALMLGIAAYERYLTLQPDDAINRVNLAALQWQADQRSEAITNMQQAIETAPNAWQFYFILGDYAEDAAETAIALQTYKRLTRNPYNLMYPEWDDTALRREIAWGVKRRGLGALVLALDEDLITTPEEAEFYWQRSDLEDENSTRRYVLSLLLTLETHTGDDSLYRSLLSSAQAHLETPLDRAWLNIGQAALLRSNGDVNGAAEELASARAQIAPAFSKEDYPGGTNIAHFQFLRYAAPRQFLPQVYYPTIETLPMLRFLADD